ncbi:Hypothetical predicted protein [Marmota monax]|uniref:Uncharacterized protein n=1 Tax=Marmota monax TaxID=9995 RepID=A0A5E4ARB1_MARMO|nr:Hypothetical predicted protein [Marmota monax]
MSDRGAGQSGGLSGARAATVSDIQVLMRRKEEIEGQIKANHEVLEGVSGGSERSGRGPGRAGRPGGGSPALALAVGLPLPGRPVGSRQCGHRQPMLQTGKKRQEEVGRSSASSTPSPGSFLQVPPPAHCVNFSFPSWVLLPIRKAGDQPQAQAHHCPE